ncbi:MAG: mechanosensitive ion channel domain-containing protein [Pseudomonadota bacterium]
MGFESLLTIFSDMSGVAWALPFAAMLLIAVWITLVQRRIYHRAIVHFKATPSIWDDAVLEAIYIPAQYLVWFLFAILSLSLAREQWGLNYLAWVDIVFRLGILAAVVWAGYRLIDLLQRNVSMPIPGRKTVHPSTAQGLARLARILLFSIGTVVGLHTLGVEITGLLAVGGVGGIVLGFAAQNMLSNLFGSMMIHFDRPFQVGDWIRSPDRDIEGYVEDIGWRLTQIRTLEGRPLYVPNAVFSTIAFENPSRMINRRVLDRIRLSYKDWERIPAVVQEVRAMIHSHTDIDQKQTNWCNVSSYGDSYLEMTIQVYTKATDTVAYRRAAESVLMDVLAIINKHDVSVAMPTATIHVPELAHDDTCDHHHHNNE